MICRYSIPLLWSVRIHTVIGQKYSTKTKYSFNDCDIYLQNIQLGANMRTEIYRYQKFVVLALPLVKIFDSLVFLRGVNIILIL